MLFRSVSAEAVDDAVISLPNVFSPNNDGYNDIFKLKIEDIDLEDIEQYSITVINRWGEILFESNDVNKGWDGKKNGKDVSNGVYYCIVQYSISCINNGTIIKKRSTVQLLR